MRNGISIYIGLDNTREQNLNLMERAAAHGITRIFTSLHIPETNAVSLKEELGSILKSARAHGMDVIADITPSSMDALGVTEFSLGTFRMLGIETVRLDYGYGANEIASFSHNKQRIRIGLNASTITGKLLTKLINAKTNFKNVDALHNFYPRPGTGLSEETLVRKTMMLHKAGVSVGAFVPSLHKKRPPLFDGLPTLEDHRTLPVHLAGRHLIALGIDSVFIGDSLPSEEELSALGKLREDQIVVKARMLTQDPIQQELLRHTFTARVDEARDAIRANESRGFVSGPIQPENTTAREPGDVTIDNENYLRYMGELEIIKRPQEADARINVAAAVDEDETFLLDYITPGRKFSFEFTESVNA